jgi:hypothetical protein
MSFAIKLDDIRPPENFVEKTLAVAHLLILRRRQPEMGSFSPRFL